MACISCPFECSEESDYAQNTGCLPSSLEIVEMKRITGNNWACHSHPEKLCSGLAEANAKENLGFNMKQGRLIHIHHANNSEMTENSPSDTEVWSYVQKLGEMKFDPDCYKPF